jgi:hypothetical protein
METDPTKPASSQASPILPQTGVLTPAPQTTAPDAGVDSLAAPPDMGREIARNTIAAGQENNGNPRDWAENAIAGVHAALAGFGAAGKVPEGAGALYGVGKAAQAHTERADELRKEKSREADRQQQLALEKRRVDLQETGQNREYQLKLAENARQQAESVRLQSEHDKRMTQMDDEHTERNMRSMHEDVMFRESQLDREEALKSIGAKPMQIAGQDTPVFDDLGQMERYAMQNKLGEQAHQNGYRTRPVLGADGKYHLYEVPDTGPDWHEVKDAEGKTTKIFGDPLSVLNYQEKVAQTRDFNSQASLRYAEAAKARDDFKNAGTVKAARKRLDAVGGDPEKLNEGEKEALRQDAGKEFKLSWDVYQAAQRDMSRDPDFVSVPVDAKGNPDRSSQEFKDLAAKYHVEEANEQLGDSYDFLRKLGHGYKKPGEGDAAQKGPAAPTKGAPITPEAIEQFKKAAGGDPEKAKALAIAAGWGPPQSAPQETQAERLRREALEAGTIPTS